MLICLLAGSSAGCQGPDDPLGRERGPNRGTVGSPGTSGTDPTVQAGTGATAGAAGSGAGTGGQIGSGTTSTPPNPGDPPPPVGEPVVPGAPAFDAGSDPNRNAVQAGQVCGRLAQIQCAGEAFCCSNPGRDRPSCENVMRAGCVNELYLDAITGNPISGFDPASAQFAFDRIEQLASECDPEIAHVGASQDGLLGMLRGTIEAGGDCYQGIDKAQAAAALASCTNAATTSCMPRSAFNWSCDPRGPVGTTCFTDLNCHEGLYCPNPALTSGGFGTGKCAARKPISGSCRQANECASLFCKGGLCVEPTVDAAYCLAAQ